jgi:hypothetical protein
LAATRRRDKLVGTRELRDGLGGFITMNVRQIGGVLIAGGAACLLFYGSAFI